ncbi:Stress response protein nst1, partial [Friedmanniomyces endolithicus]
MPTHHRSSGLGVSRPLTIRLAVCQACKQLANAARGEDDGFYGVDVLLRQIESNRPMLDSAPSLREIEEICETEGDSQNGGGELHIRRNEAAGDGGFAVKWDRLVGTPDQSR